MVCFGYGFAKNLFPLNTAFLIACVCYLLDQMLMSVGMARSTYIKKIALTPGDIQPALTASVTIDHIFSISVALLGGLIWNRFVASQMETALFEEVRSRTRTVSP